jgi:hypothetical protein
MPTILHAIKLIDGAVPFKKKLQAAARHDPRVCLRRALGKSRAVHEPIVHAGIAAARGQHRLITCPHTCTPRLALPCAAQLAVRVVACHMPARRCSAWYRPVEHSGAGQILDQPLRWIQLAMKCDLLHAHGQDDSRHNPCILQTPDVHIAILHAQPQGRSAAC